MKDSPARLFDPADYRVPVEPYRPSSGSEGLVFEHRWCSRCIHDKAVRTPDHDFERGCQILAAALLYNLADPEYPEQWVYSPKTSEPTCTGFEQDPDEEAWADQPLGFPLPSEVFAAVIRETYG